MMAARSSFTAVRPHVSRAWLTLLLVAACNVNPDFGPGGPTEPVEADSVAVEPDSAYLTTGDTVHLTPKVFNVNGTVIGLHPVEWSTSDASVATIEALEWYAVVTAEGPGVAWITVAADEYSAVATVTVDATNDEILYDPASP